MHKTFLACQNVEHFHAEMLVLTHAIMNLTGPYSVEFLEGLFKELGFHSLSVVAIHVLLLLLNTQRSRLRSSSEVRHFQNLAFVNGGQLGGA